jgi:hypothetical protein
MEPLRVGLLRIAGDDIVTSEAPVLDLILLILGLGPFALLAAYAAGCERV